MAEETTPAPADEAAPATAETPPVTENAPTFEGEFDAEKAAALVANVRTENKALKDRLKAFEDAKKAADEAEMTEAQKAMARAEAAEARLAAIETESLRAKVAAAHNLPADAVAYLTGADEAAMTAQAEGLAKLTAPAAPELPGRPTARLVPGHSGSPDAESTFDPAAVAKAARRR